MKLQSLEMIGFGPFAERTKIHFEPFQTAPILLIHGRTGAGKTSVLDALTYALYGQASGMDGRTPDTLRSHMIEETEATEVKLIFQLQSVRYRASRSPEYLRRKKRGEGWIKESPTALLERWEADRWVPVATRVSEVNRKVESLLGFSYEQFTQVLILPQGKFRQMLIADSIQRRDIFRQLFRTGDLEAIQQRMRDDTAKMRSVIEEKKIRIDELFGQLTGSAGKEIDSLDGAKATLAAQEGQIHTLEAALVRDRETLNGIRNQRDRAMRLKQMMEHLAGWERKIQELTEKEDEMKDLAQRRDLGERAQEIREDKESRDRAVKKEEIDKSRLDALMTRLESLRDDWEALPKEGLLQEEVHALMEQERIQKERHQIKHTLSRIERRQQTLDNNFSKSMQERNVFEERKRILSEELNEVQVKMRQEIAYSLAKDLEEDMPCPVCGSVHHPKLAEPVAVDLEAESRLLSELSKVEEKIGEKLDRIRELEGYMAELEGGKNGVLEQLEALPESDSLTEKEIQARMKACQKAMEKARAVREKWTALKGQIAFAEEQWRNQKTETEKLMVQWETVLGASGFETPEAYLQAACSYKELQVMNRTLQQHQLDLAEAKRQVAALKLQMEDYEVEGDLDLTELDRLVKEWMEAIDKKTKVLAERTNLHSGFKRNMDRLENEIQSKESVEEEFGTLAWMANVASGRNNLGMDFEQFVLRRYLAEVLLVANQRLNLLTDGRYELRMQEERRDRRKRFGLELDVFDFYTGDTRPVGSLSGGESFKASLALALALSDVVRSFAGGIELETLFIDEGFGTLDPSSLDQAIEVLVELKQQNRMVGIISHVPELKERIDNRIEVVKNRGKQGSRIRIHLPGGGNHETLSIPNE